MDDLLNLESLLAFMLSDIDINLLQNEEQTGDNDKDHYTKEEIRKQLSSTGGKFIAVLKDLGYDMNKPLLNEITI
jgi:hypothetical protein